MLKLFVLKLLLSRGSFLWENFIGVKFSCEYSNSLNNGGLLFVTPWMSNWQVNKFYFNSWEQVYAKDIVCSSWIFLKKKESKCKRSKQQIFKCARERAEPRVRSTQVLWIQDQRGKFLEVDLGPYDSLELIWRENPRFSNYPEGNE